MDVKIEVMERQWASQQIQEYVEHLQGEIAKAMAIPSHLLRPETFAEAERKAWQRTEIMRREVARIIEEHSWPMLLIKA